MQFFNISLYSPPSLPSFSSSFLFRYVISLLMLVISILPFHYGSFFSPLAFLHFNLFINPKCYSHSNFVCLTYIICFNKSYQYIYSLSYLSEFPLIYFLERWKLFCFISRYQNFLLVNDKTFFISNFSFYM